MLYLLSFIGGAISSVLVLFIIAKIQVKKKGENKQ